MKPDKYYTALRVLQTMDAQQGNGFVTAKTLAPLCGFGDDIRPVTEAIATLRHEHCLIIASRTPPYGYRHIPDRSSPEAKEYFNSWWKKIKTEIGNLTSMAKSDNAPTIFEELGMGK